MSLKRSVVNLTGGEVNCDQDPLMESVMENASFRGMHGVAALSNRRQDKIKFKPPRLIRRCDKPARAGYHRSVLSHEYLDEDTTLQLKISAVAELLRNSKHCVVYAGAGLSTSAGIGDYASRNNPNSITCGMVSKKQRKEVEPALGHRVLVALHRAGYIKEIVQQNHDGLPQQAGMPQHCVNEIHGAWFDPSNPVVTMSGSLREDLVARFDEACAAADLVLALGSSLAATNADRIVELATKKRDSMTGYGAVIVSLQQTYYDEVSSIRIFARLDDVLSSVAAALEIDVPTYSPYAPAVPELAIRETDRFLVPYSSTGEQSRASDASDGPEAVGPTSSDVLSYPFREAGFTTWDLRKGSRVMILYGPGSGRRGEIVGKNDQGHYLVQFPRIFGHGDEWLIARDRKKYPAKDPLGLRTYVLGSWWVEAATKGLCDRLPFVSTGNTSCKEQSSL